MIDPKPSDQIEIETALDKFAEAGAKVWTGVEPRSLRGELVWSKEPPTVSGWYWCRCKYWEKDTITEVRVGSEPYKSSSIPREWAGPINPPAEPNSVPASHEPPARRGIGEHHD